MADDSQSQSVTSIAAGSPTSVATGELAPGRIVGGLYKIKSVIGRGGMGVVYVAEHQVFHRDFALKALAPERVNQSDWMRFQTEGKAIAKLDHPNIVKVYDMGTDGPDCLYYVMDLLPGHSLADYIEKNGALEVKVALDIVSQLCAGLGYAHKLGLVHRDLKPNNVILCGKGNSGRETVKIIDFGLVKLLADGSQHMQSQTATGQICGSPLYMSPEQCMGGKIDQRTDIYSLGCTLFECLTGVPPFKGETGLATVFMHQTERVPALNDVNPAGHYPAGLDNLLARMLDKIPGQRHQSMEQVLQDLDRIRAGKSISPQAVHQDNPFFDYEEAHEHEPAEKRPTSIITACIVALLGLVFLGWACITLFLSHPQKPASPIATHASEVFGHIPNQEETVRDDDKVRPMFEQWPQISNGIVIVKGERVRLFKFPPVPVGYISWSGETRVARGEIAAPPDLPITLSLARPDGLNTRRWPGILRKIGPDDISVLEVKELQKEYATTDGLDTISPQLIHAVSGWRRLHQIDFYHANLPLETVRALNELQHIDVLLLHAAEYSTEALVEIKWLDQVQCIDAKHMDRADLLLRRLKHSPNLIKLTIDGCGPSAQALRALASCPKLEGFYCSGRAMSDGKISSISEFSNLQILSLEKSDISVEAAAMLGKLKKLKLLALDEVKPDVYTKLKKVLPQCDIQARPVLPNVRRDSEDK
jgi:serine/threonine protein kinase